MDGSGRNGGFTAALLKHIGTQGIDVKEMLDRVGAEVATGSKGSQNPWVSSKFYGKFYFAGSGSASASTVSPATPSQPQTQDSSVEVTVFRKAADQYMAGPVAPEP